MRRHPARPSRSRVPLQHGRAHRRRPLPVVRRQLPAARLAGAARLLLVQSALVLGGMAYMFTVFGDEVDPQLDVRGRPRGAGSRPLVRRRAAVGARGARPAAPRAVSVEPRLTRRTPVRPASSSRSGSAARSCSTPSTRATRADEARKVEYIEDHARPAGAGGEAGALAAPAAAAALAPRAAAPAAPRTAGRGGRRMRAALALRDALLRSFRCGRADVPPPDGAVAAARGARCRRGRSSIRARCASRARRRSTRRSGRAASAGDGCCATARSPAA